MIRQEWRIIKSISPGGWGKSISLWRAGGDVKRVHTLCVQRLLLSSYSARLLAVRRVSQDNRGKRTPGVDGVASLTPPERFALAQDLRHLDKDPQVVRRIYIDKPGSDEKRPLGIPTLSDRARQAFVFVKPNSWANYYKTCAAKRTFNDLDTQLFWKLTKWLVFDIPENGGAGFTAAIGNDLLVKTPSNSPTVTLPSSTMFTPKSNAIPKSKATKVPSMAIGLTGRPD